MPLKISTKVFLVIFVLKLILPWRIYKSFKIGSQLRAFLTLFLMKSQLFDTLLITQEKMLKDQCHVKGLTNWRL